MEHWTCKLYEHKQVLYYLFVLYFFIRWVLWMALYWLGHPAHVKPWALVSPGTSSICQRKRLKSPIKRGRIRLLMERGAVLSTTELQLSTEFLQVHRASNSGSSMWKNRRTKENEKKWQPRLTFKSRGAVFVYIIGLRCGGKSGHLNHSYEPRSKQDQFREGLKMALYMHETL